MNIFAFATWCPYPLVNGSTIRQYHLVRAMAAHHDVDLLTFAAPTAPSAEHVAHLRTLCRSVTILPRSPFAVVPGAPSTFWSSTPRSILETDDPDVRGLVVSRLARADVGVGLQLSAARYLEGAPIPVVFEEAEPRQILTQMRHARTWPQRARLHLTWWKQARYLQRLMSAMAAVTVASDQERAVLEEIGAAPGRVHVVPNGADAAFLDRPRTVARPPRLIYPGAITFAPNLEAVVWFLAKVMPRIRAARPDVEFWVTGDTGSIAVDRIPNAAMARFTGRLPDVTEAVGTSAVTVVPLLTGAGTRLKVLEALALGTPVVSTRLGAEGLDLEDGQHVAIADAPETFADRVLMVLGDAGVAARLSAQGRSRVRARYTWDAIGREFCDIVAAVAAGERT